jgi:hypothetical protein
MNAAATLASFALAAGSVVMRKHSGADGKSRVFALLHDARDFMPQDMWQLSVHVPGHELAGAKPASLRTHNQASGGHLGQRLFDDLDTTVPDVAGEPVVSC